MRFEHFDRFREEPVLAPPAVEIARALEVEEARAASLAETAPEEPPLFAHPRLLACFEQGLGR